jgi:class 3 adenylate cyclase/tetratricopeptide (TPR) repeat protein
VTILFADMTGSVALTADMDPERVDEVLSHAVGKMRQAVTRFGGTVNRVSGDGIMAIFGAPFAHEHHAEQACHAALAILEEAQSERTADLDPVRIRVGLHSGEVVVRSLTDGAVTNYEVAGVAVSVAARMEQVAEPGRAVISPETRRLAGDAIEVKALGPREIKGLPEPMELFELVATAADRHHAHRLAWDDASRFVGREPQVAMLASALQGAMAGRGSIVAVIGEAGSGKSRLVQEFLRRRHSVQPVVVTGHAQSFGQRGYQLIISMLEAWLGIFSSDSAASLRDKIRLGVEVAMRSHVSDQREAATVQALTALCDPSASDPAWLVLDPSERRNRTAGAVCALFQYLSEERPLVLVAEDLHWADVDSLHVLAKLADVSRMARILMITTMRDDSPPAGVESLGAALCHLRPLNPAEARELLRTHLIANGGTQQFEDGLIAHTGGNPLFIEECLISLSETGDLIREGSQFRPLRTNTIIGLPTTIRALITARIDRLQEVEKDVLQVAAVIGHIVPRDILAFAVKHDPVLLDAALAALADSQFLIPDDAQANARIFHYRHALTRDAVYQNILRRRRREIHAGVVAAFERLYEHRIMDYAEAAAEHAQQAEDWQRAARYFRMSAKKAVARSSNSAAVAFLRKSRDAAERLPEESENIATLVDVLLDFRYPLFKLGGLAEVSSVLSRAAELMNSLDDPARLHLLYVYRSHIFWVGGDSGRALEYAQLSAKAAARVPDERMVGRARFQEGMVLTARGDYQAGIAALSALLGNIAGGFGAGTYPDRAMAANAHSYLTRAFAEIGDFEQARYHSEIAVKLADAIEDPFSQSFAALGAGFLQLAQGEPHAAITWLERSRAKARSAESEYLVPLPTGFLGMSYALIGQAERAIALLEEATRHADSIGFRASQPYRLAALARAYLAGGRIADAVRVATQAQQMADLQSEVYGQVTALYVLGEATRRLNTADSREAEKFLARALELARRHGLAPLEHQCAVALGVDAAVGAHC